MMSFFKYYMFFFSGLIVLNILAKIADEITGKDEDIPKAVQIEEFIYLPVHLVGILGMYGYVYKVAFWQQWFWVIYALLLLMHAICVFWLPSFKWLRSELPTKFFVSINVIFFIISLPFYIIICLYAFFDAGSWNA